ncbi:Metallo-beta-lactamase superfamily protein [compost metagenome]
MLAKVIFDDGEHKWIVLARDPEKPESVIDTNQYFIVSHGDALILDPGGTEVFPAVLAAASYTLDLSQITTFFASHQDPDVFSSLPLWLGLCPKAKAHIPKIWTGFIAHFGVEYVQSFVPIPDEGGPLSIGSRGKTLQMIPAHYCHASGNYSVYDPHAKILFSGDIGAALLPDDVQGLFVEDFERHTQYMKGFHQRWMPSNEAKNAWVRRVRQLDIQQLCPQHGAIFRGDQVKLFLDWLEALEVGAAIRYMDSKVTTRPTPLR